MKIKFFGSNFCKDCLELFVLLNTYNVDYDYIDAFDESEEVQNICDNYFVDKLPHIQFLDENNDIVVTHIGPITEDVFLKYLEKYFPNY